MLGLGNFVTKQETVSFESFISPADIAAYGTIDVDETSSREQTISYNLSDDDTPECKRFVLGVTWHVSFDRLEWERHTHVLSPDSSYMVEVGGQTVHVDYVAALPISFLLHHGTRWSATPRVMDDKVVFALPVLFDFFLRGSCFPLLRYHYTRFLLHVSSTPSLPFQARCVVTYLRASCKGLLRGGLRYAPPSYCVEGNRAYYSTFSRRISRRVTGRGSYGVTMEGDAVNAAYFCLRDRGALVCDPQAVTRVTVTLDDRTFDVDAQELRGKTSQFAEVPDHQLVRMSQTRVAVEAAQCLVFPKDVWTLIFHHVHVTDVHNLTVTCKFLYRVSRLPSVFPHLLQRCAAWVPGWYCLPLGPCRLQEEMADQRLMVAVRNFSLNVHVARAANVDLEMYFVTLHRQRFMSGMCASYPVFINPSHADFIY